MPQIVACQYSNYKYGVFQMQEDKICSYFLTLEFWAFVGTVH